MTMSSITALTGLLVLSSVAYGCMPQQQPPPSAPAPTTAATPPRTERHVYRFDFVLTTSDSGGTPTSTAFTLNLQEHDKGEVTIGKNVPLTVPAPGGGSSGASPRQDVGIKVAAAFNNVGDDLILDVVVEMSSFDPSSSAIRKVVAKGNALASAGKAALVTTLEADNKHYQLNVTPTKLR